MAERNAAAEWFVMVERICETQKRRLSARCESRYGVAAARCHEIRAHMTDGAIERQINWRRDAI